MSATSARGTAAVIESYLAWIGPERSHAKRFAEFVRAGGNDPRSIFDYVYQEMHVVGFGRLGKFDYLSLLGRLGLAPLQPGRPYLVGSTGPLKGARLLFGGHPAAPLKAKDLEGWICELDADLRVGMEVMEDALCNWQKSPSNFVRFRG